MANNKVQLANGTVLIDITDTTANASDVLSGEYFYNASGVKTEGSLTIPSTYTVTKTLTNVTTSNNDTEVLAGGSFYMDLTPSSGMAIGAITVTMGGIDITEQVFKAGVGEKIITQNGIYDAENDWLEGYSEVIVNVPNTYTSSDEGKVVSGGTLVAQTSDTVTQNGTVDTTLINSLTVNVSGGSAPTGTKQISITQNGTVTEDVTDYANAEITVNVSGGSIENLGSPEGSYTLAELFYCLSQNNYSTGTVTVSSFFPTDSESVFCDTGYQGNVRGILIFDLGDPGAESKQPLQTCYGVFLQAASTSNQTETSRGVWKAGTTAGQKMFGSNMTSYRVNGGKLYIKPKYAGTSASNTYFWVGHTYRWIAWPYLT